MAGTNITKVSTKPDTTIVKMGQTTNGSFGSDPMKKVKGSRPTRDIAAPSARG